MSNYKKSYEGDYTKTYKNYISWRKQNTSRKKEYDTISKKLNDTPYNKKERLVRYNTDDLPENSERVYADGRTNTKYKPQKTNRSWNDDATYAPKSTNKQTEKVINQNPQPTIYPPTSPIPQPQQNKPWKGAYEPEHEEDDGNYNFHDYPIEQLADGRYRNLKTNRELTLDQAKDVLRMAGFSPSPNSSLGAIIFLFIVANVVFPLAAPLIAIGYGIFRLRSKTTTWQRVSGNKKVKYALPATDSELSVNLLICRVIIVIGLIAAFIRYGALI